nr:MAG TPA: hypothetical protein [Caudoviricetes sp.]
MQARPRSTRAGALMGRKPARTTQNRRFLQWQQLND